MGKVTIPIATEDILKGLAEPPQDELERVIEALENCAASRRIRPVFIDVNQLDALAGLMSVGGDAVTDTENIHD